MKGKIIGLLLTSVLVLGNFSSTTVFAANDNQIYQKEETINLSDLDLKVSNDSISVSEKSNDSKSIKNLIPSTNSNLNNLKTILKKDKEFEKSLIKLIKDGKKPVNMSAKEVYFEDSYNPITKEKNSKLLTKEEVNKLNNNTQIIGTLASTGNTVRRGKLSLYITVSESNTWGEYWVQANSSWDLSGTFSPGENAPAPGDDFIAVGWDSKYTTKSNPSANGTYQGGSPITLYPAVVDATKGMSWSFKDCISGSKYNTYASGAYAGVGVKSTGSRSYCTFTASYIHTWKSIQYTPSFGAGGASFSVSPSDSQWSIASSYSGTFN